MFKRQSSDVLIVGAGPTGLFTALKLVEAGISTRIIDRHWRTGAHSYALALHPRSLELLEGPGLTTTLLEHGHRVNRIAFYEGATRRGAIDLGRAESKYPFALVMPQSVLEGELENRLAAMKTRVLWNHRLEAIRERDDEIAVEVSHLDRVAAGYPIARSEWTVVKSAEFKARYVVGADGYHSHVREHAAIAYRSFGEMQTFAVYEFEAEEEPGDEVRVVLDGNLTSAFWPMAGRRCRWSFQIAHPNEYEPGLDRINELIARRAPWFARVRGDIYWSSMVQFDRRLAAGLGRERVWIAGDAAHLTGPVGVQSMNAGLIDGSELAWRLAEVIRGERGPETLATYETSRMPELTPIFGAAAELGDEVEVEPWVRRYWSGIVGCVPASGATLSGLVAQLGGTIGVVG